MAAGITQAGFSVLVCEKMEKPQRKVRITGKGRCNPDQHAAAGGIPAKSPQLFRLFSPPARHGSATGKRSFSNGSAFR